MKKSQKRQKRLVLVAMVLMIGLVAGMGAMTYSKYITTGSTNQTATAAKWGFVVNVDAENLFVSDYKYQSGTTATYNGTGGIVVNGTENAKVVAPGTSGSMAININGKAEVNARLTIVANEIEVGVKMKEIFFDSYYPVKWTLNDGVNNVVEDETLAAVIAHLEGTSQLFVAGTEYNKTYTLTWEWEFVTNEAGLNGTNRNVEDSLIGYKANGRPWSAGSNSISGTFIGTYQLDDEAGAIYNDAAKICTTIAFNLSINIEQTQEVPATP